MSDKFEIPDAIYLQCHDDDGELFDRNGEEVTWCEDDTDGHNIKYIRQDAVLTPAAPDSEKCPHCDHSPCLGQFDSSDCVVI